MRKLARRLTSPLRGVLGINHIKQDLNELRALTASANQVSQLVLLNQYRERVLRNEPLPTFEDVEFRAFSQNGEDGILLYIFGLIGMGRRRCVEICASDGIECNTANLIVNHGWSGLLFDGDEELIERGRAFYSRLRDTHDCPPTLVCSWITRENINTLIKENGIEGPVDLLSLDLDGVDYWIWDAIEVIKPRVVIAEFQCVWGSDRAVTVPYSESFKTRFIDNFAVYSGASLPAFVKLARARAWTNLAG